MIDEYTPTGRKRKPIIHGRYSSYNNYKCRCLECRLAWNKYNAELKQRRRKEYKSLPKDSVSNPRKMDHGTEYSYQNGCSCEYCLGAHAALRKESNLLTPDQKLRMLEKQDGKCALCKQTPHSALVVDHIHGTREVRGLLCQKCNTGLGKLGDNFEGVLRALDYLDPDWRNTCL